MRTASSSPRGVADDKGDVMARIQALRLYTQEHGPALQAEFPHRGEEEVGSRRCPPLFAKTRTPLRRACLWEGR